MYRAVNIVAVLALLWGCSTTNKPGQLQTRTEYDKAVNWSDMRKFRMSSVDAPQAGYARFPRYERMVQNVIIEQLTSREYVLAEDGPTDFRVTFQLIFKGTDAPSMTSDPFGADAAPGSTASSSTTQTSTLTVRMLHPVTGQALWTGTVSGFTVGVTPENDFRKAVWRLLAEFPPLTG